MSTQNAPDETSRPPVRILVIDDEPETCQSLMKLLQSRGMECEQACDGDSGVEKARRTRPDLIVCDVNMPGMDGYGVLRALHNDPITSVIPFIFLSGEHEHDSIRHGMGLGADDYLTKPFAPDQLFASILARIERQKVITRRLEGLRFNLAQSVPHEFFTPLNSILGFSILSLDTLRAGKEIAREDLEDAFSEIRQAGEQLLRIASNYVMFTQLSAEETHGPPPSSPLLHDSWEPELCRIIRAAAMQQERMTDLRFSFAPATLNISGEHLKKIVSELLDNALKFSRGGETISITGGFRNNEYVLQVQDRGCGMDQAQIESVEPMVQFDRQRNVQSGVGLGLSICRLLARRYGGSLGMAQNPEKGLTVTVALPVAGPGTQAAVEQNQAAPS